MGFFIYSRYIKGPAIRGYYPIKRICDAYIFRQTNICNERHKEPMPFRRPGGRIHRPPRLREPTYRLCRILSRLLRENCVYNLKTHAVKKLKGAYLPKINETSRLPKKNNIYPHLLAGASCKNIASMQFDKALLKFPLFNFFTQKKISTCKRIIASNMCIVDFQRRQQVAINQFGH